MNRSICRILHLSFLCSLSACVQRQYRYVNVKLNWTEAQSYCRQKYTDLATFDNINSIEELIKSLKSIGIKDDWIWIGLHRTDNFKWKWSLGDPAFYTNSNSQYQNWGPGQPVGNESCTFMKNGKWYNGVSTALKSFVCYNDSSKRHILVNRSMNWRDAQSFCRENHTDLVTVRNQTENLQIEKIMNDIQISEVWIGLFRDSFEWSDQSKSSFRNWQLEEPNNGGGAENCTVVWVEENGQAQWYDDPCGIKCPFICHEDKLFLIKENVSWSEALRYCRENYVDLVSVHSEKIQYRVMEVAKQASTAAVWLGLHHYCSMNMWFWVRGEIVCRHDHQAEGDLQTVEEERMGVAVQSGGDQRWISLPETQRLNFICTNSEDEI
ncbi:C-type mannose receptor 2-like [Myxocyprinus asiaticus]|uniref:C-type mannose receptor 2-like n=1 Tax=Myxocyprinus asiaticus TaxID=70543 RepID=UPI002221F64A|nr:C-type mannose receptor 2-like [Myxocyprinus asiaticus]